LTDTDFGGDLERDLSARKPLISIIIPTFNSLKYLEDCLGSVRVAMKKYGNAELFLIDNGSTDGTYERLSTSFGDCAKILRIEGVTISALRNHGASLARGEFLSFIDSDCVIPPDYFRRAAAVFATISTDAAGNYYDLPPNSGWVQDTWFNLNRRTSDKYVPYLFAGNLIIKADVFRSVGGFDEKLVTGEDAELGIRMNKAGYKTYATPQIPALHLGIRRNLSEFFKKTAWHGLGMFGSMQTNWFDKPLIMTLAQLLLTVVGVVNLFLGLMGLGARVAVFLFLPFFVPAMAALFRMVKAHRVYRPLRSTFLYFVFFSARLYALVLVLSGQTSRKKKHESVKG
jgi:glycosyltransferase involved in cell wall biosynthesis